MRRFAQCVWCAALFAACADQPSRLDQTASTASGDPWAAGAGSAGSGSAAKSTRPKRDKPDVDPFDLGSLLKIADSLGKPGHYEAPLTAKGYDPEKPHWDVLTLSGGVVEREQFSFTGGHGVELRTLTERLRHLAKLDKLTGLVLRIDDLNVSLPDAVELRAAFHEFRAAGKQLACHVENASNASYLVLAACSSIGIAPVGDIAITGPATMPVHIKPLLDKLGIRADFLHVGAYKGAAEPLTRDAPSKEMEETLGAILDRRYQTMVDIIAADRKLEPAQVKALIDTALFTSEDARAAKLVDAVDAFEGFRDAATKDQPWGRLTINPGKSDRLGMMSRMSRFLGAVPPERPDGDHIAVVYALGDIVNGSGDGVLGAREHIAADTLVAALHTLANDTAVKAVVLRIDSGGGSAQASELIWRAVAELKAQKPVVVSMSDLAASGGYYIACGATKIFALDDTLTGSIGVIGGKLALRDALGKLGINTFPIGRGKHATLAANLGAWTDEERKVIQTSMESVYKQFVGRVAEGRHKTPEQIQPIAQGRVWTGQKAKELGLVDEIGGLDAAIAEAVRLGGLTGKAGIEIYPPEPTLRDVFAGFGQVHAPLGISTGADALFAELAALDPHVAAATEHLVKLVLSFRSSSVQAVAILPELP